MDTQTTQTTWQALPAVIKWLLGAIGSGLMTAAGIYIKATYHAATNCLPTIEIESKKQTAALTELVGYFKAKAEDGKL